MTINRTLSILLTLVLTLAGLTACSSPDGSCPGLPQPQAGGHDIVLVVGAHANGPAPGLPTAAHEQVIAALAASHQIKLIRLDGQPVVVAMPYTPVNPTDNCTAKSIDFNAATTTITNTITSLTPAAPGTNPFAALTLAATTATTLPNPKILIIDSMLSDQPPLDFSQTGMITADPTDIATFITTSPYRVDLHGLPYELIGVGETTDPQSPLPDATKDDVAHIWAAVITSMNGTATITPAARPTNPVTNPLPVKTAPLPDPVTYTPPAKGTTTTTVFPNSGPVNFPTNSATLTNPTAARTALTPIATWLASDPTRHIRIHGRTDSTGTPARNKELAQQRATTIADLISTLATGINTSTQITTSADGTDYPDYINDRNPDGTLNPVQAAHNRNVTIVSQG